MNLFKTEVINNHITRIISVTGESMFLVKGKKEAVLIDTGTGIGSLRDFVSTMNDKPLKVILTHGHIDHAGGASEFDDVYMSSLDNDVLKESEDMDSRMGYARMNAHNIELTEDMFQPIIKETKELNDGDSFDLGDVTLDIYALPGHTKGSIAVLFREDRILLTGDACNTGTFLFSKECTSVEEYKENLSIFRNRLKGKYDQIILSHGSGVFTSELLDVVIDTCDMILEDKDDKIPTEFMGYTAHIAVAIDFEHGFVRRDGKEGNLIYNPNHIRKEEVL